MNDFLLIFRRDFIHEDAQPAPDKLQDHLRQWQDWFGSLAAQNRLARPLQRWDGDGRTIKSNGSVTNGPYAEIKESIGGLIIIKADSYEDALEVASGCPILTIGGNVEIRMGL